MICLLSLARFKSNGQLNNPPAATYFDSIPLFIQSGLFVKRLYPGHTFITLAGRIKIFLKQDGDTVLGDTYFKIADTAITRKHLGQIEYRFVFTVNEKSNWRSLPTTKLLLDTILQTNEQAMLQFRWKIKSRLLQQTIFSRPRWIPFINGYRSKNASDSFDARLKSKAAFQTKMLLPGFDTLKDNNIILPPGGQIELQFANKSLIKDSAILYRLKDLNSNDLISWQLTGHLLNLRTIKAKHEYVLEVKYAGTNTVKTYYIQALAFWWQRTWAIVMFSVLGFVLITGLPYVMKKYLVNKAEIKRKRIEENLRHSRGKIPTHFVSNTISTITELVVDDEPEKAEAGLMNLSDMMRYRLNNSHRLFASLSEELDTLYKYIAIEQLRFEFRYIQEIDAELNAKLIEIPHLILQPSVENAVKHGVSGMGNDGLITLSVKKQANDLIITVQDNGQFQNESPRPGHGHGTVLTRDQIADLQKLFPKEKIEYLLAYTSEGTIASFYFENWLL